MTHTDRGADVLDIRLLGAVRAAWAGRSLPALGTAPSALLALLALRPEMRSRDAVAADLWPDGAAASRAWLRQALWHLRRALAEVGAEPDGIVSASQDGIGLSSEALVDLDVTRFEACLRGRPPRHAEAIALYRGELATGLVHECFAHERERLADLYEDALAARADECLAVSDYESARDAAAELLRRDPLREEGHAVLIAVYGLAGTRSQVSRQYRRLRTMLSAELGVDPLPETEDAYRLALVRATSRGTSRPAVPIMIEVPEATPGGKRSTRAIRL